MKTTIISAPYNYLNQKLWKEIVNQNELERTLSEQ